MWELEYEFGVNIEDRITKEVTIKLIRRTRHPAQETTNTKQSICLIKPMVSIHMIPHPELRGCDSLQCDEGAMLQYRNGKPFLFDEIW